MFKYMKLFLMPTKFILLLPFFSITIVILGLHADISDASAFISGISTGIYASLFWVVFIQNKRNSSPFMNQALLFSLPVYKRDLIKPWLIANQIAFFLIYMSIFIGLLLLDLLSTSIATDHSTILFMIILTLICCILFNLETPLSFSSFSKKSLVLSALVFCLGLFIIPMSQYLIFEVFMTRSTQLIYLIVMFALYSITTLLAYHKSQRLIQQIGM